MFFLIKMIIVPLLTTILHPVSSCTSTTSTTSYVGPLNNINPMALVGSHWTNDKGAASMTSGKGYEQRRVEPERREEREGAHYEQQRGCTSPFFIDDRWWGGYMTPSRLMTEAGGKGELPPPSLTNMEVMSPSLDLMRSMKGFAKK